MNIYELMDDYGKPYAWAHDIERGYIVINTIEAQVIAKCNGQREAMTLAHRLNCYAFAVNATKAKDAAAMRLGLASKDEEMRKAFNSALINMAVNH